MSSDDPIAQALQNGRNTMKQLANEFGASDANGVIGAIVNRRADAFRETATQICKENIGKTNEQISQLTGLEGLRCENFVGGVDFEHGLGGTGLNIQRGRGGPSAAP